MRPKQIVKLLSCSSICCAIGLSGWTGTSKVAAQIIPDNTMPQNTIVVPNGNSFTIDGGTTAGRNLFHSFSEFSVPTLREAFFNNSPTISNIISRVTGGKISNIDGLIRANGTANLFLLNPAGIIFGPNARLDIGGSFVGSTADSIIFEQNIKYSATDPQAPPLLTINVPLGLQWNGQNTGAIQIQGAGHSITVTEIGLSPLIGAGSSSTGLRVKPGNAIALLGGDVNLDGGILTAPGGHIQLGSLREGILRLNLSDWTGDYSEAIAFGSIVLSEQALADVSGIGSGDLEVRSQNLTMTDGSVMLIENQGNLPTGSLRVNATDDLVISGSTRGGIKSGLHSQAIGETKGADIAVSTGRLLLSAGGEISATTFSQAPGGKITVNASDELEAREFSPFNPLDVSGIHTLTFSSADAGDITLETRHLTIADGASASSPTFSSGSGGAVRVNADSIELIGVNPLNFIPTTISSTTQGTGDSGIVEINTSTLAVRDGAAVATSTLASGNAGGVTINASESLEVSGRANGSIFPSQVDSSTFISDPVTRAALGLPDLPTGNSGDVTINTPLLLVTDSAQVSVRNDGPGNPGKLEINADYITLQDEGGITAFNNSGSGGDIQLNTRRLQLDGGSINASVIKDGTGGNITIVASESIEVNEAIVSVSAEGTGDAGDLTINSNILNLERGTISATSLEGKGGNLDLQLPNLTILRNNSQISTRAGTNETGGGNGGNININSDIIAILENSNITANAFAGAGGNIEINTLGIFADGNSGITASSQFGVNGTVTINNPAVDGSSIVVELPNKVQENTQPIATGCAAGEGNSFTITGRGGLAEDPTAVIRGQTLWQDTEDYTGVTPSSGQGQNQPTLRESQSYIVEATGWVKHPDGMVELVAELPQWHRQDIGQNSCTRSSVTDDQRSAD